MFTKNKEETANLFRFARNLPPGTTCAILRPTFANVFKEDTGNPIICTVEPLVPIALDAVLYQPPPCGVSTTDFKYFVFHTSEITLANVDAVSKVCNGVMCDGQYPGDCSCVEIDNKNTSWAISAEVELQHWNDADLTIRGKHLAKLFAPNVHMDPDNPLFDVLTLADSVENCVEIVNNMGGWCLVGWFKPATTDTADAAGSKFHVVRMYPTEHSDIEDANFLEAQYKVQLPSMPNIIRPVCFRF